MDFSVDNATITMNVTGAITQTLTVNVNNNTANGGSPLAIGTVVDINMGTINMTTCAGSYNFNGLITMATDTFHKMILLNDTQVLLLVTGGVCRKWIRHYLLRRYGNHNDRQLCWSIAMASV